MRWLRWLSLGVLVGGTLTAFLVFRPTTRCAGELPICQHLPAYTHRVWALLITIALAFVLLVLDTVINVGKDRRR